MTKSSDDDVAGDVGTSDTGGGDDLRDRRSDPADAFAALSDPLRVNILRELSSHHRTTGDGAIGFAALRKRVGVRDSGRFRYHLNELREQFVEKTDDGYRLTHAGIRIVAAILAGTYTDEVSMGPAELDSDCPFCDQPAVAVCEDGRCLVTCPNDHSLFQWSIPPNAAANATLPEVVDLAELLAFQAIEQTLTGVCPQCYDPIETEVVTDGPPRPVFRAVCDTCGARVIGPISFCLFVDPEVMAFCRRHGLTLHDNHVWEFPIGSTHSEITVTDEDPPCVKCTVTLDDETLHVTVNKRGHVVTVDSPNGT